MAGGNDDIQFGTSTTTDSYLAFTSDTNAVSFIVRNLSGKDILIQKVGGGNTIKILNGFESPLLYGNPDGYQWKNNTDTASATVELVIYDA